MELGVQQQIFEQVGQARKILIALPESLNADNLGSALALRKFLSKLEKEAEIITSGSVPDDLKFLPGVEEVKKEVVSSQGLVVVVETGQKQLDELSYQVEDGKLKIFLKAKTGAFVPQDVSFQEDKLPVDLVIILECRSLPELGELFKRYASLFYETPKINIDHRAGNEHFGSVNLVDISSSSVSEILTGLFEQYEKQLADEDMATNLLAGIISKTKSFQHVQTTPRAMMKASLLMGWGGRQQEIVKQLYKTKSLSLLRLWGRALARLKILSERVAYSMLNTSDFEKAEAAPPQLFSVVMELLDNLEGYDLLGLMAGLEDNHFVLYVAVHNQVPQEKVEAVFGPAKQVWALNPQPYRILEYEIENGSLALAEQKLAEDLKQIL
jgi:phosphoesterase RecJ-like protein